MSYDPVPQHAHCRDCGASVPWDPSVTTAYCRSCARTFAVGTRAPRDVPLPAMATYGQSAEPHGAGRRHRLVPCPECGAESWLEGDGRRSCLEGHVFRVSPERTATL